MIEPSARKIETHDSTLPAREAVFVDYEPDCVNLMESYNDDTRPIRIQGETFGKDESVSNELRTKLYHDSTNERGRTTGRYQGVSSSYDLDDTKLRQARDSWVY